jgi:hypothetical protein
MWGTTLHELHYSTLQFSILQYTTLVTPLYNYNYKCDYNYSYTTLIALHYNYNSITQTTTTTALHHITSSSCGWGTATTPKPRFGPAVGSLCHPCITTTHLSYSVLSLKIPPPPGGALLARADWIPNDFYWFSKGCEEFQVVLSLLPYGSCALRLNPHKDSFITPRAVLSLALFNGFRVLGPQFCTDPAFCKSNPKAYSQRFIRNQSPLDLHCNLPWLCRWLSWPSAHVSSFVDLYISFRSAHFDEPRFWGTKAKTQRSCDSS